jgi:hypothetical protein
VPKLATPRGLQPWLPVIGAVSAVLVYLFAQGMVVLGEMTGGGAGLAVGAFGQLMILAAPVSGLVAARVLSEQAGEPLHAGAIALVVIGGMLAVGPLAVALR